MSAAVMINIRPKQMPITKGRVLDSANRTNLLTNLTDSILKEASNSTGGLLNWLNYTVLNTHRNEILLKIWPKDIEKYLGFFTDDENQAY